MKAQKMHQGDVQIMSCIIPSTAKTINKKPIAFGEHSGHQHVITGDYELLEDDGIIYAKTGKCGAILQHIHERQFAGYDSKELMQSADHKPIILQPEQEYVFGIHRQFDPFENVWKTVKD